jgi:protocatechuate 3,4-dioxygenase beta subunit
MKYLLFFLLLSCISFSSCSQNKTRESNTNSAARVGGPCEGCEAIYESPVPEDKMESTIYLPDWNDKGPKLEIKGVVYKKDGSPAPGVIIYVYHTDQKGLYPTRGDEKYWGKRHGYIRGWMKTNDKGEYKFYTLRPASYPQGRNPQHIHVTIKEPGLNEYWIDEYLFSDDPYLSEQEKTNSRNYGGNGLLTTKLEGDIQKAERNIYLGKNIQNYPSDRTGQ